MCNEVVEVVKECFIRKGKQIPENYSLENVTE